MSKATRHTIIFPLLLVLMEMAVYLSNDMYLPALPIITHDLNSATHLVQLTLTTWFLGSMSLQLILGPLADHIGRKPILLLGGLLFIVSSLACALAANVWIMLIARYFQGMCVCSTIVAGYATVHELFDQKQAIKTMSWMASIIVLAPAFGPLFGSLIMQLSSWHAIFIFLSLWVLPLSLALLVIMPETLDKSSKPQFTLNNVLQHYKAILFNKRFLIYVLVFCALFAGIIIWITGGPFLVMTLFQQSPLQFSIYTAIIFIAYIVGTRFLALLLKFWRIERIIRSSVCLIALACLLMLAVAHFKPHDLMLFVTIFCLYTFAAGFVFAPLQRLAIDACTEPMGTRVAVFSTLMTVAGTLATLLVSIFYTGTLISLASLIAILGLICVGVGLLGIKSLASNCYN